jgi:hypothetical protein
MDKHNVEWIMSDGTRGYPAGDFFSAAMEIVLLPRTPRERFSLLETMCAHADSQHKQQLAMGMPQAVDIIGRIFSGEISRNYAFGLLTFALEVLPILVVLSLPELQGAIYEYATR